MRARAAVSAFSEEFATVPLMMEFQRIKEGDSVAFPYSWLGPSHYHPSRGILLVFAGDEVFGVRIRRTQSQHADRGYIAL